MTKKQVQELIAQLPDHAEIEVKREFGSVWEAISRMRAVVETQPAMHQFAPVEK